MNCPACGNVRTKVVVTREVLTPPFSIVRRYACKKCDHRWYAAQPPEVVVRWVTYAEKGAVVQEVHA